jgi:DNA-binding response OmpR family regulator
LPILFITGFADTAFLAVEADSHHILQKTFYTADLVAKIEAALRMASGYYDRAGDAIGSTGIQS